MNVKSEEKIALIKAELVDWRKNKKGQYIASGAKLETDFRGVEYDDVLYLFAVTLLQTISTLEDNDLSEKNLRAFLQDVLAIITKCKMIEHFANRDNFEQRSY